MSDTIYIFRFVKPDAELVKGSQIIDDEAMVDALRAYYKACRWIAENEGGFYAAMAFLPSLYSPDERINIFLHSIDVRESVLEDLEENGPTSERTQLVRWPQTINSQSSLIVPGASA